MMRPKFKSRSLHFAESFYASTQALALVLSVLTISFFISVSLSSVRPNFEWTAARYIGKLIFFFGYRTIITLILLNFELRTDIISATSGAHNSRWRSWMSEKDFLQTCACQKHGSRLTREFRHGFKFEAEPAFMIVAFAGDAR